MTADPNNLESRNALPDLLELVRLWKEWDAAKNEPDVWDVWHAKMGRGAHSEEELDEIGALMGAQNQRRITAESALASWTGGRV